MSDPDRRDPRLRDQAQRVAAAARLKMKAKREASAGGLGGIVASRAGDWDLTDQDVDSMRRQETFWNPLVDKYFRMEIDRWETIPASPVLLVGVHSGAPFVWDAWTVAPAAVPQIPLPAKIRTRFMPPIEVNHDLALVDDDAYVEAKYEEVRRSIQSGMTALARKRKFPVFR